jgi:hypothetical protein
VCKSLASITRRTGLDPWALAAFNGLPDFDTLHGGQCLRIVVTNAAVIPATGGITVSASTE